MKPFRYVSPTSLSEASRLLMAHGSGARALAGGQSLIPLLKLSLVETDLVVDLKRIPGLSFIRTEVAGPDGAETVVVGALTQYSELERSPVLTAKLPLLAETAAKIGHPLVRNRGTLGGSLAHCDPAADLCVTSLALRATMHVAGNGSRRTIRSSDFFKGAFTTALEPGELLEMVSFPVPPRGTGHSFKKLTLGHGDFPLLVVSATLRIVNRECTDASIAMGGVADRAETMTRAEAWLLHRKDLGLADLQRAAELAEEDSSPPSDIEVSASYKKRMVSVLVRRALVEAASRGGLR